MVENFFVPYYPSVTAVWFCVASVDTHAMLETVDPSMDRMKESTRS